MSLYNNFSILPNFFFVPCKLMCSGSVGRVLDSVLNGLEFETHQRHCVVSLSKTQYPLLSTGSTQEDRKLS